MTAFSVRNINVQIRTVTVKREVAMARKRREAVKPLTDLMGNGHGYWQEQERK